MIHFGFEGDEWAFEGEVIEFELEFEFFAFEGSWLGSLYEDGPGAVVLIWDDGIAPR